MKDELERKLAQLPTRPGVYYFKDASGTILYIGKANSLRARVRSHFAVDGATSLKNREMLRRVADIDTMVVGSEAEALLLEANLIKEHRPRFNIQLRDDKRYPYIKVTLQEPFPRVYVTRRLLNDGARYFGPYTEVGAMRAALEVVKRLYTVRSCRYDLPTDAPARPCLDYHIGRCLAPCVGLQTRDQYRGMVDEILEVLAGRVKPIRLRVTADMKRAAEQLDFERAATLRDVLNGLESLERRQRALDVRGGDTDVVGIARDRDHACAVLLRVRDGKLLGREVDFFENLAGAADDDVAATAVTRFYFGRGEQGVEDLPREVLLPVEFEDRATVEELLSETAKRRITSHIPVRGDKLRLVELANQNARHLLEERAIMGQGIDERADDVLYDLQDVLALKVVPRLIACFDISHMQGTEVVGSCVVFRNGEPDRNEYRRFRIRGDWGNDDFRSMEEVVGRYLRRRLEESKPLPDVIIIDGGRGQLSAAVRAAAAAGAGDVVFASLAKREEEVYLVARPEPLRLPRTGAPLRLLQRLRNEAHRFAHGYNRTLRTKRTLSSELSSIAGIGKARQRTLLEHFGSVRSLKAASADDIAALPGFSTRLAASIVQHFAGGGAVSLEGKANEVGAESD
ncbi:MAG TPA: excinuclease ABC subunit UvrC [Longimicrobiales bacterium]|nr:excinuclease ABC subunit UvrC [Longimicrobiales bacterium]